MDTKKVLLMAVIFSLGSIVCFIVASFLIKSWYVYDVQQKEVSFTVMPVNHIGFDLNRTVLTFGKIEQGGSATRGTTLVSDDSTIAKIRVDPAYLASWLVPDKNDIFVDEKGNVVTFTLTVPQNASLGVYNGTVTVFFTRRMFWE